MRGGDSYIPKRCNIDSNKYLKFHAQKQESNHIIYLDANNLSAYAMFKFLETSRFKWISPKEFY